MKTTRYILFALSVVALGLCFFTSSAYADDFVDDIYYTPSQVVRSKLNDKDIKPTYDKHVREIVFIEDTITTQQSDTVVRAIIRDQQ